jgi:hypothetical protein
MSFFDDLDIEDNNTIALKFEPVNVRDDFEYAFKMFSERFLRFQSKIECLLFNMLKYI